jgi:hypothetical protein
VQCDAPVGSPSNSNEGGGEGIEIEIPNPSIPIDTQQVLVDAKGRAYEYEPLNFPDSIRFLELEPSGKVDDPTRCRFFNSSLAHGPSYEITFRLLGTRI